MKPRVCEAWNVGYRLYSSRATATLELVDLRLTEFAVSFFEAVARLLARIYKGFEESLSQAFRERISCAEFPQGCIGHILLKNKSIMKASTAMESCKVALSVPGLKTRKGSEFWPLHIGRRSLDYQTFRDDGTGVMRPLRMGEIQGSIPCHSTSLLRPWKWV